MKLFWYIDKRYRRFLFWKFSDRQILFRLEAEERFILRTGKVCVVPAGFTFDGATIPWLLRPFFPQMDIWAVASLLHDWHYFEKKISRKEADREYLHQLLKTEMRPAFAYLFYIAVRIGGKSFWKR
jgi:hypothetical protein